MDIVTNNREVPGLSRIYIDRISRDRYSSICGGHPGQVASWYHHIEFAISLIRHKELN
jgi:hypothetical protein